MSLLDSILTGGRGMGPLGNLGGGARRGGIGPLALAVLGTLAYRSLKNKGSLSPAPGASQSPGPTAAPGTGSGLGPLGGLLTGGALSEGLEALLNRFRLNGHGDKAESWIKDGPNTPIAPHELEEALGEERMSWLMAQTGMSREELLAGLAQALPATVDQLTPKGRIPTESETQQLI